MLLNAEEETNEHIQDEPIKEFVVRSLPIRQSLIAQFETLDSQIFEKSQSVNNQLKKLLPFINWADTVCLITTQTTPQTLSKVQKALIMNAIQFVSRN